MKVQIRGRTEEKLSSELSSHAEKRRKVELNGEMKRQGS
jgi:hypothetical protein